MFKCRHYGFEHDADVNAAMNIAVGVSVSSPDLRDKLSTSGSDDSRPTVQNCGYPASLDQGELTHESTLQISLSGIFLYLVGR